MPIRDRVLLLQNSFSTLSPLEIASQIAELNSDFLIMPRAFEQALKFHELKFSFQKLRRCILDHLLTLEVSDEVIDCLAQLKIQLLPFQFDLLRKNLLATANDISEEKLIAYLIEQSAGQTIRTYFSHRQDIKELLLKAGPSKQLPMVANRRSKVTSKRWMRDHHFSEYHLEGQEIHYKGMKILPGDMILSSVNLDGNGVYTTMIEPKGYAYHFGIVAIVEQAGVRFPIVLETYEVGVRWVPLNQFLSQSFNCYFEIFRLNLIGENFYERINHLAKELPPKVKGYNFDTEDPDHTYLACTSVATYLFKEAQVEPIATQSHYSNKKQILANLDEIELKTGPFLSPWDFIASERTHCVGFWDNNYFLRNICREVVEREMEKIFSSYPFKLSQAPLLYYFNRFGVKNIQANNLLGRIIGKVVGYSKDNLPNASYKVLSMIEIFEHTIEKCVRNFYAELASTNYLQDYQDIEQFRALHAAKLTKSMLPLYRLFRVKAI